MRKFPQKITLIFILLTILSISAYSQVSGIEPDTKEYDAIIYPNPVINNTFIVKSDAIIKKVEVINVIGQTIAKVNNQTELPYNIVVRIHNCDKGMYMVKILFDNNQTVIKKMLKK
ncbi:MAG: T9SS type A sorting domain-containing protein [bacterium]|nr:T9SS type A sorting domain-containing protein [bacterium]